MDPLTQYIQTQLAHGYTSQQIQQVLLQQGYSQEQIQTAFNQLFSSGTQQAVQSTANNPSSPVQNSASTSATNSVSGVQSSTNNYQQIYTYVYQTLASGYPAEQLYSYLLQQGYDKRTLQQVFTQLHNQYQTQLPQSVVHTHELSSSTITKIGMMVIVVAIIIGGFFFMLQGLSHSSKTVKLLQVSVDIKNSQLHPGDDLEFQVTSINEGDPGRIDIQYKYVITDVTGRVLDDWMDSKAFQTRMQFIEHYDVTSFPTGSFKLTVTAFYGATQSSSAYKRFTISEGGSEQQPSDVVQHPTNTSSTENNGQTGSTDHIGSSDQTGSDVQNSTTGNSNPATNPPPVIETPSTNAQSDDDLLSEATDATSAEEMAGYCQLLSTTDLQDNCYSELADRFGDMSYCSLITTVDSKEFCYSNFIIIGNLEACQYVSSPENKDLCNEMKQLNDAQQYFETGDSSILESSFNATAPSTNTTVNESDLSLGDFDIGDFVGSSS